jgi:hypothetical protein
VLSLVFLVFVFGCSFATTQQHENTQKPTPLSLPTSVKSVDIGIQYKCLEPASDKRFPSGEGTVVTFDEGTNDISLWDLEKGQKLILGKTQILTGVFSTDQKLAYINTDLHEVNVVSTDGKTLIAIPAPASWVEVFGWMDSESLLIGNMPLRQDGSWYPPSSIVVINTKNSNYKEVFPDYPGIYPYTSGPPNFGLYSYSITAYDPTMTRVVYPGVTPNYFFASLWDISNLHELARIYQPPSFNPPQWKQDGSSFLISAPLQYTDWQGNIYKNVDYQLPYLGGNELFNVSKNGKATRLTYLTTRFIAEENSYVWSPNNEFVAFWLNTQTDNYDWQLATLNIETGEIISYCVGGGDGSYSIIWSPDGNKIISTVEKETIDGSTKIILVDLVKETANIVTTHEVVVGWMANTH